MRGRVPTSLPRPTGSSRKLRRGPPRDARRGEASASTEADCWSSAIPGGSLPGVALSRRGPAVAGPIVWRLPAGHVVGKLLRLAEQRREDRVVRQVLAHAGAII